MSFVSNLNLWYVCAAALMVGAASVSAVNHNWRMVIISVCYAVANAALAGAK